MPTFEIRYGESSRDMDRDTSFHFFDVRCGGAEERIAVGLADHGRARWRLGERPNAQEIESRTILFHLREHLTSVKALTPHRILLTAWDRPDLGEGWTVHQLPEECPYGWKECRYQELGKQGPLCAVAHPRDPFRGRTTDAACALCGLPSTDVLCDNLVYPETVSAGVDQTGLTKRTLVGAQCNIGSEQFAEPARDAKLCVPGGRDCWFQTYTPDQKAEAAERDLAAEALEMIDTLNIIFRDQFDIELFRLKQFRTGRVLLGPCATEEAFAHKLQVLGDLIDLMNSKELGETQGATSDPGSINWLAAFLGKAGQGDSGPVIQRLRDIKTVRKQVAAHSAATDDFRDACARLSIALPITDWEGAWGQVLSAFLDALRKLQALLP